MKRMVEVRPYKFLWTLVLCLIAAGWIGWEGMVLVILSSLDNRDF